MNQTQEFISCKRPHIVMITNHGIHDWTVRSGLRDTGGQNHYVNALSETLVQLGFKVTTFNRGGFPDPVNGNMRKGDIFKGPYQRISYIVDSTPEFIRKEDLNHEKLTEEAKIVAQQLKAEGLNTELIISHYWDAAILANLLRDEMEWKGVKHIWIPHSIGALKKLNFKDKPSEVVAPLKFDERISFEKEALSGIDYVASTSGDISRILREYYDRNPELFLPPCVDTDIIHPEAADGNFQAIYDFLAQCDPVTGGNVKGKPCILEVSRTDHTKRKDVVISAFAQVLKNHPDAMLLLTISSDHPVYQELMTLIDELGIRNHIVFIGMVPREIMSQLYAITTIYISPSDQEGFGMSVQEACASKRAAVASDRIPFATEYLLDSVEKETIQTEKGDCVLNWGKGGVVVPAGNIEGFAHALNTLLSNEAKRSQLAEGGYELTIPYFTWPHLTKTMIEEAGLNLPA